MSGQSNPGLPPLTAMDFSSRLTRLRQMLDQAEVRALLVTKQANVRWLTGFTGSNGAVIVTADTPVVVTDSRYRSQVATQLAQAGVEATIEITSTGLDELLADGVPAGGRLGLESHHITWKRHTELASRLEGRELVAMDRVVEELRKQKDDGEISRLRRAAAMADLALAELGPMLGHRPTERAVARTLDGIVIDLGADGPSYDTIVASGPNAALPHAAPTDRIIEGDDLVIIDVGARLDGYGSDMTRTFVAGGNPSAEHRRLFNAVIESQAAGVAALADGVEVRSVDAICRQVLESHDLGEAFVHGTGHGIGLEIHEDPILSARTDGILRAGYVVTVEPGVYLPAFGGVRIEDSVIIGNVGNEAITLSPKTMVP